MSTGLKLVLDMVPNHSSDEHEWFVKSVQRIDPYTDYYVWLDGDAPGVPPTNWASLLSNEHICSEIMNANYSIVERIWRACLDF